MPATEGYQFEVQYLGELECRLIHRATGSEIRTDAPLDNQGKGRTFSPTDLLANSLAACMSTIMGIKARDMEVNIDGTKCEIKKVMGSNPRHVAEIHIHFNMPHMAYSEKEQKLLEAAALHCPVAKSLSPELKQVISFNWPLNA